MDQSSPSGQEIAIPINERDDSVKISLKADAKLKAALRLRQLLRDTIDPEVKAELIKLFDNIMTAERTVRVPPVSF